MKSRNGSKGAEWSPSLTYRPALDGIRAIAVLAVMAFHASYGRIRGGYLGVEMFFVLSGFLITSLLLAEWRQWGELRFRHFYARRAARLLPALAITILGVYIYACFIAPHPPRTRTAVISLTEVIFYVANWAAAAGHSVFGPLGHTWSLAIEEQFYLLFPAVLLVALRRNWSPAKLAAVAASLGLASWVERAVFSVHGDASAYFRSDTRAGTLLLGVLLAVYLATPRGREVVTRAASLPLAVLALAIIMVATIATGRGLLAYALVLPAVAVGTAVLIAHIVTRTSVVTKGLALGPLAWTGRRSYGLYLYSFPIVYYVTDVSLHSGHIEEEVLRFGLAFGVAALAYRFVEAPILRRVRSGRAARAGGGTPTELEHVAPLLPEPVASLPQAFGNGEPQGRAQILPATGDQRRT